MYCLEQNNVQENTCPYSSDSAKMGRYLDNHIAERAMSDTRKETGIYCHMREEKRFHVSLGSLNVGTMTHGENN